LFQADVVPLRIFLVSLAKQSFSATKGHVGFGGRMKLAKRRMPMVAVCKSGSPSNPGAEREGCQILDESLIFRNRLPFALSAQDLQRRICRVESRGKPNQKI
jgi:hypothetical protein